MMAFFLLMWLINTTSPESRSGGIADYFAPASGLGDHQAAPAASSAGAASPSQFRLQGLRLKKGRDRGVCAPDAHA